MPFMDVINYLHTFIITSSNHRQHTWYWKYQLGSIHYMCIVAVVEGMQTKLSAGEIPGWIPSIWKAIVKCPCRFHLWVILCIPCSHSLADRLVWTKDGFHEIRHLISSLPWLLFFRIPVVCLLIVNEGMHPALLGNRSALYFRVLSPPRRSRW